MEITAAADGVILVLSAEPTAFMDAYAAAKILTLDHGCTNFQVIANMVTGDYSRGASGFWIQNGKRTFPVSEVTIAGHLLDMFRTLTPANDLAFRYSTNAPTLRVEGLTVAGQ